MSKVIIAFLIVVFLVVFLLLFCIIVLALALLIFTRKGKKGKNPSSGNRRDLRFFAGFLMFE
jgi:hypothetical protein